MIQNIMMKWQTQKEMKMEAIKQADTELKTKIQTFYVGELDVLAISDSYKERLLDTRIEINGKYLCTIAGTDIDSFIDRLITIVNEYCI